MSANYITVTQQLKLKLAFMWTFHKTDLKLFRTIYNIIMWLIPPFNLILILKNIKKKNPYEDWKKLCGSALC